MRITRIIASPIVGVFLILGACASPAPAAPAPVATAPAVPAPAATASAAPAPVAATPAAPTPVAAAPVAPAPVAAAPAAPANKMDAGMITYTNFKITPSTVKVGETTKVTVSVTNSGVAGNFAVALKVDGKVVDEQTLTCKLDIDCDETKEATFNVKMAAPGTYTVTVGNAGGQLVVQ